MMSKSIYSPVQLLFSLQEIPAIGEQQCLLIRHDGAAWNIWRSLASQKCKQMVAYQQNR